MKIFLSILITAAFSFSSFARIAFAQNIQTGNASAKSSVTTNVNGSGSVYTKIEVEANGEKKSLEASGPGEYKLQVDSQNSQTSVSSKTNASTKSAIPPTKTPKTIGENKSLIVKRVENLIKSFVRGLKELFKIS